MKRPTVRHYTWGKQEALDVMQEMMTEEEFRGYLTGNIIKYLYRYRHKGTPIKDLEKAQVYLKELLIAVGKQPASDFVNEQAWDKHGDPDYTKCEHVFDLNFRCYKCGAKLIPSKPAGVK